MESLITDLAITWLLCVIMEMCDGVEWIDDDQPEDLYEL